MTPNWHDLPHSRHPNPGTIRSYFYLRLWTWCWERLKAGGEGDNRGWDGWMASLTWWTWVWASSGSWWWTGKPGALHSMGSQKSDVTEGLNWTDEFMFFCLKFHWTNIPFFLKNKKSEVAQLCPTLCDPMDCSLWGSFIHGLFQARVLEWVAISFSIFLTFVKYGLKNIQRKI